jgi:aryl-alcohol dehydrogenase-like predicted oxidoreductase
MLYKMQLRQLGTSQLFVSPLAFGGNVIGWTITEQQSFDVLNAFVASGCNFIDTADIYCRWATGEGGESETIIGKWVKQKKNRKDIILATKVGMDMGNGKTGLSKKYILKAVDDSLKRLQTDYIDLYQSHKDDERVPIEETLEAFQKIIKEGKVRYIGASNFSVTRLQEAITISKKYNLPHYQCIQPHYNLCERKLFEEELETFCVTNKLGVINYFPLASGFLTGKYRTENDLGKSVRGGGVGKFMNQKGFLIIDTLSALADKHSCKIASVVLAWYMARSSITAPIASATSSQQLKELVAAIHIKLDASDIEKINACSTY